MDAGKGVNILGGMVFLSVPWAIVGTLIKSDRWKKVSQDKLKITTVPNSNGAIGLGITIPF